MFPEQASTFAGRLDAMTIFLLAVSGFFALLIVVFIVFFAVRYRRREDGTGSGEPDAAHAGGSHRSALALEITWTLVPLVLAMIMFGWGASLFMDWASPPEDSMEIYVVAKQWMWKLQHLEGQREINQLHVPLGRPVKLTMTSQDVIHSFFVPQFRVHQDVLPNRYTSVWFQATRVGTYDLFCSQYCGTDHAKMIGKVIVMEPDDFVTWLQQGADGSPAVEGRKLFQKLQCVACHSADSGARGPVLEQLFGRNVHLQDGQTVKADEAYIRESILLPDAKIVAGFQPIMPTFRGQVDEEQIMQLIAFIKALGPGQTPPRTEENTP